MKGTFTLGKTPPASSFVLMSNDDSLANASMDDLKEARATRRGNEELLWLRKGKARYMVRDAATLLRDVSEFMTLQAGDVLMLGTDCLPDGTRLRAKAGDRIEISAPDFAPLVNTLVEDAA